MYVLHGRPTTRSSPIRWLTFSLLPRPPCPSCSTRWMTFKGSSSSFGRASGNGTGTSTNRACKETSQVGGVHTGDVD
jgi:hypothetical protein